ncbi:hypothetical protein MIR68_009154 [Amoeboaphelidium protococcarum]|nr:hypothetical protein MIR68_009154 [Amoeboaphelidium protococcarum]
MPIKVPKLGWERVRIDPKFTRKESPQSLLNRYDFSSNMITFTVGGLSNLFLKYLCNFKLYGGEKLFEQVEKRLNDHPHGALITYCNHQTTLDDPLLFGVLKGAHLIHWRHGRLRWTLIADDICFTNPLFNWVFTHTQGLPTVRNGLGDGIYQPSINHGIDLLNHNGWLHVFPEGKVNYVDLPRRDAPQSTGLLPFRWGIARLIMETQVPLTILPMYVMGMNQVLPDGYMMPKLFKKVSLTIGDQVDMSVVDSIKKNEGGSD